MVPTEAIIQTGKRTVVMLAEQDEKSGESSGRFRPVDVEIGIESDGQTEVKRGLQLGQRAVVSSQFLIDSEASLKGVESRLNVEPKPTAANTASRHTGTAKIEAIGGGTMTLSHGPIASQKCGAMTMDFKRPKGVAPRGLEAGDRIDFEFYMDAENMAQLTTTTLLQPEPKPTATAASRSKP